MPADTNPSGGIRDCGQRGVDLIGDIIVIRAGAFIHYGKLARNNAAWFASWPEINIGSFSLYPNLHTTVYLDSGTVL